MKNYFWDIVILKKMDWIPKINGDGLHLWLLAARDTYSMLLNWSWAIQTQPLSWKPKTIMELLLELKMKNPGHPNSDSLVSMMLRWAAHSNPETEKVRLELMLVLMVVAVWCTTRQDSSSQRAPLGASFQASLVAFVTLLVVDAESCIMWVSLCKLAPLISSPAPRLKLFAAPGANIMIARPKVLST